MFKITVHFFQADTAQLRRFFENSPFINNISKPKLIKRYISYRFEKRISFIRSLNDSHYSFNSNHLHFISSRISRISANESIRRRNFNIMFSKFDIQLIDIETIITNVIARYVKNNLLN